MQTQLPMQEQFVDLFRNGMKTASDMAQASLQTGLRVQEKQLDMVRGIVEDNSRCAEALGSARSVEELLSLQSRLAGAQMQRMAEFWSMVWQSASENQQAMISQIEVVRAAARHGKPEHRRAA